MHKWSKQMPYFLLIWKSLTRNAEICAWPLVIKSKFLERRQVAKHRFPGLMSLHVLLVPFHVERRRDKTQNWLNCLNSSDLCIEAPSDKDGYRTKVDGIRLLLPFNIPSLYICCFWCICNEFRSHHQDTIVRKDEKILSVSIFPWKKSIFEKIIHAGCDMSISPADTNFPLKKFETQGRGNSITPLIAIMPPQTQKEGS